MGMRFAGVALAGIVTVGTLSLPARAQQRAAPPDNPRDVKELLFEVANAMGMLRGLQQEDSIITLEHWAAGTITTGQERLEVPEYRLSVNYAVPGLRVDVMRKGAGQARRSIEVVSGTAAWNETERGRGATPARESVRERLVHLWTTPMGIVKAARAAGGAAKMTASAGAITLTFPLPAPVGDVIATATLRKDASLLAKAAPDALKQLVGTYVTRVTTTGVVTETTYAEYGDWNWDDYQADIMLPRRIVRRAGSTTVDLTTKNTNTYNPYVVMPVPDNIRQAGSQ